MAKLTNVTKIDWMKHVNYGINHPLKDNGIVIIGRDQNSDIVTNLPKGASRQHAFILGRDGEFYAGDMSLHGSGLYEKGREWQFMELGNILNDYLLNKKFEEECQNFKIEREYYGDADGRFDENCFKRKWFFDKFIKKEENIDALINRGRLIWLEQGDVIRIYPNFRFKFSRGIFERIFKKRKA